MWSFLKKCIVDLQTRTEVQDRSIARSTKRICCFAEPRQKIAARHMESIRITGKRFWKSIYYVWFIQRFPSKKFMWQRAKKSRSNTSPAQGESKSDKWRRTKWWHNSNADICDKTVDYQFYNTCGITAELCGRTEKTANVGITIRQIPYSRIILGVEDQIQNTGYTWFWFSLGSGVMDQRSGDGRFFGRAEFLTFSIWEEFSKIRDAGREDCLCSEQDHPEVPVQKRRSASRSRKPIKRIGSWEGDKIAFMIYDYFRVTGAHGTVEDYADLLSVTLHDDNIQGFDTRWEKVLLSMTKKFHRMIFWKVCTNWGYVSLRNSKPC